MQWVKIDTLENLKKEEKKNLSNWSEMISKSIVKSGIVFVVLGLIFHASDFDFVFQLSFLILTWQCFRDEPMGKIYFNQRSYQRWLDKRFIKQKWSSGLFWAVGAAEKKLPTAISTLSMQLFGVVFSTFCGQKKF